MPSLAHLRLENPLFVESKKKTKNKVFTRLRKNRRISPERHKLKKQIFLTDHCPAAHNYTDIPLSSFPSHASVIFLNKNKTLHISSGIPSKISTRNEVGQLRDGRNGSEAWRYTGNRNSSLETNKHSKIILV